MANKPTVSIVIPAYNEAANIVHLLRSIAAQRQDRYTLEEVIVMSDGSTDDTINRVQTIEDDRVSLKIHAERSGKVACLNEAFREFTGDILVQLDGDIRLEGDAVIDELIRPFLDGPTTALVCGVNEPAQPTRFIERLANFGVRVWSSALAHLGKRGELYYCTGQVRAFSRAFTQAFVLPESVGSSEDFYSFYFAKAHGFTVVVAPQARVVFRLPATVGEYVRQMARFMRTAVSMRDYFGPELFAQYETMTNTLRLRGLVAEMKRTQPHIVVCYLALQAVSRLYAKFTVPSRIWDGPLSSKSFNV